MNRLRGFCGVGLATVVLVTGCSQPTAEDYEQSPATPYSEAPAPPPASDQPTRSPEEKAWFVGEDEWYPVTQEITQEYVNSTQQLMPGDECVVVRGARILLNGDSFQYSNPEALGTECPDGAIIAISQRQVTAQDRAFRKFDDRREVVSAQTRSMTKAIGGPIAAPDDWVTVVNAKPIMRHFSNADTPLSYGDRCFGEGMAEPVGKLKTGETVLRIINPDAMGTPCPSGTLYLDR